MLTRTPFGEFPTERLSGEELGLEYDLKLYNRRKITVQHLMNIRRCIRMGIAPVICDGDIVLGMAQSEYIVAKYGDGKLAPKPDNLILQTICFGSRLPMPPS
jgi:hypothetical protein